MASSGSASRSPVHDQDLGRAAGQLQGGLDRLGQALADVVAPDEPVHHHLDGVGLVAGQVGLGPIGQLQGDAVDPDPGEALLGQVVEKRGVLALAPPHHRGHDLEAGALGQLEHPVDDLLGGLAGHRTAALGAVGMADAGVEQTQVVVDLGDGPHGRTRVARGRLLVDGDGRGQALDEVDVGLVHLPEELAGVGREGLDVAALALGVDGVEGQRRLARPGQAGEDDQPVPGQVDGDVAEIVLAGPANDQTVGHSGEITGGLCHPGPAAASMQAGRGGGLSRTLMVGRRGSATALGRLLEGHVLVAPVGGHFGDLALVGHGEHLDPADVHDLVDSRHRDGDVEAHGGDIAHRVHAHEVEGDRLAGVERVRDEVPDLVAPDMAAGRVRVDLDGILVNRAA